MAVGAGSEPAYRRVLTWTPETNAELFGGLLRDLDEGYIKAGGVRRAAGRGVGAAGVQLALVTAWQTWGMGPDNVQVTIYTHEDAPLGLFGSRATAPVRDDLEEAGVRVEIGVYVAEDPEAPGRLVLRPDERTLEAQCVVALPCAVGPGGAYACHRDLLGAAES